MMYSYAIPVLVVALSAAHAAPAASAFDTESTGLYANGYTGDDLTEQIIVPQKRAALVLDRLLIALQKALHDESLSQRVEAAREGPRTAPLRLANFEANEMTGLQRRGQGTSRGRVLRCYFNAVTCF